MRILLAMFLSLALSSPTFAGKQEDILAGVSSIKQELRKQTPLLSAIQAHLEGLNQLLAIPPSTPSIPLPAPLPPVLPSDGGDFPLNGPCPVAPPDLPCPPSASPEAVEMYEAMKRYEAHVQGARNHHTKGGVIPSSDRGHHGLFHVDYWRVGGNANPACNKGGFRTFALAVDWLIANSGKHRECQ